MCFISFDHEIGLSSRLGGYYYVCVPRVYVYVFVHISVHTHAHVCQCVHVVRASPCSCECTRGPPV